MMAPQPLLFLNYNLVFILSTKELKQVFEE